MRSFILSDFLDIPSFFKDFLNSAPFFDKEKTVFSLFDPKFYAVNFLYSPQKEKFTFNFNHFKESLTPQSLLFEKNSTHLHWFKAVDMKKFFPDLDINDDQQFIVFSVKNPLVKENLYVTSLITPIEHFSVDNLLHNFNFNHFEHFCYNIQSVINNYEKLFYLIDVFSEILSAKEAYMSYSMTNVASWCNKISYELKLEKNQQLILYISALFRDVGNLFVPDNILHKASKLTEDEYELVKSHPLKSFFLLESILYGMTFFNSVPSIVKSHHERYDGTGYPNGLSGEEIPLLSRILCVADTIDAMMSKKNYRDAFSITGIIHELKSYSSIKYDPEIAAIAIDLLERQSKEYKIYDFETKYSKFITNTSLNFYFEAYDNINTLQGNLIIQDKIATFILSSDNPFNNEWDKSHIFLPTISFFENNTFYEFKCKIKNITNNDIELIDIQYFPTDKFFSLKLEKEMYLNTSNNQVTVETINIGGDTVIFRIDKLLANKKLDKLTVFKIKFDSEIMIETHISWIQSRLIRKYISGNEYIYVCRYLDITDAQRDSILRYLFKKQIQDNFKFNKQS